MKAKRGKKAARHILKTLAPGYGTYAAIAGTTAAYSATLYNTAKTIKGIKRKIRI